MKLILTAMVLSMNMNAAAQQLRLTDQGVNELRLGMNIGEAAHVVAFSAFKDRRLFDPQPTPRSFYYLDVPLTNDPLNVKYVFLCTGDGNTIKRFTLFVDDAAGKAVDVLNELYGPYDSKAEGGFGSEHYGWTTNTGKSVYLTRYSGDYTVAGFWVTAIDIDDNAFENFGDYRIDFKLSRAE